MTDKIKEKLLKEIEEFLINEGFDCSVEDFLSETKESIRELIAVAHDEYLDTLELILKEINKELKIVSHAEIKTEFEKEEKNKLKELKEKIIIGDLE